MINPKAFLNVRKTLEDSVSSFAISTSLKQNNENRLKKRNVVEEAQKNSSLYNPKIVLADPLKKPKEKKVDTVGKGWFNFEPMRMDEKLKHDIKVIQMRNYIDPKRFYKNPDKIGEVLHVGTVIEGPSEYKSARLTKRDRKQTIAEEILADKASSSYAKRKYLEIEKAKNNKKKAYKPNRSDKTVKQKKIRALY